MYILIAALLVIGAFIIITLVRAAFWKPKANEGGSPLPDENVDVESYRKNLSDAIKFKTTSYPNPDDVDWDEFEKFHAFLEERFPLIHKTLKKEKVSTASLLYVWEGTDKSLSPMALLSHQDVVPVADGTDKDWEHPAFDGFDDGEFIWGRGALDMKNHLIAVMQSLEQLIADGFVPKRTIYLCLGHDEEIVASVTSGASAMAKLLESRNVRLDSVLDEGGAILNVKMDKLIDKKLAGVGIAEKGYVDFEISVSTKGGHSSQPPKHSGLGVMADVIRDLENHQFGSKMTPLVYDLFTKITKSAEYPVKLIGCNLWLLKPVLLAVMKKIPPAATFVRSTTAVTMASGSPAANVLPQNTSIVVNFRMMPGTTIKDVENHIRKVVKNKDINIKLIKGRDASIISPTDSRAFKAIEDICAKTDKEIVVAPFLVMGGTDAINYQNICENVYRFSPFVIDTKLILYTHATNERIPISSFEGALKFFKRYIKQLSRE